MIFRPATSSSSDKYFTLSGNTIYEFDKENGANIVAEDVANLRKLVVAEDSLIGLDSNDNTLHVYSLADNWDDNGDTMITYNYSQGKRLDLRAMRLYLVSPISYQCSRKVFSFYNTVTKL